MFQKLFLGSAMGLAVVTAARVCRAERLIHVLAIGNNGGQDHEPKDEGTTPPQAPLHFADDDAAAFYELLSPGIDEGHLLTVMDPETVGLYPALTAVARPPTLAELRNAVGSLARRIEQRRREGHTNVLYIFFSG